MIEILIMAAAAGGIGAAYAKTRRFVRERLRFVDAVQSPVAPLAAGVGAGLLAVPVVWLLPVVGGGTAIVAGAGVALAVRHGARDVRRSERALPELI